MNNKNKKYNINVLKKDFNKRGLELLSKDCLNSHQILDFKTNEGYKSQIEASNFVNGQGYYIFSKTNPYTIENIKLFMTKNNIKSELLSIEYVSNTTPLMFRCECGKIFTRNFATLYSSKQCLCRHCIAEKHNNSFRLSKDDVIDFINSKGYSIVNDNFHYINNNTKITCYNNEGYKVLVSMNNFKKNRKPLVFSRVFNKDNFDYNIKLYITKNNINNEYLGLINESELNYNKIILKLKCFCGNEYQINLAHFLSTNRKAADMCPSCSSKESTYERKVEEYLIDNRIKFVAQKRFDDCKNKNTLPFDFYLPQYNCCIEVDGEQHFRKYNTFGKDAYERTLYTDSIKNEYCKNNNILLLRIPYWDCFGEHDKYKKDISNFIKKRLIH